jgi:hypothetical protein
MLPGGPVGGDVRRRISVGGAPMQGVRRVRTPVSSPRDEAEVVGSGPKRENPFPFFSICRLDW